KANFKLGSERKGINKMPVKYPAGLCSSGGWISYRPALGPIFKIPARWYTQNSVLVYQAQKIINGCSNAWHQTFDKNWVIPPQGEIVNHCHPPQGKRRNILYFIAGKARLYQSPSSRKAGNIKHG